MIVRKSMKEWIVFIILMVIIVGTATYYFMILSPKNSLELYQTISFADDFEEAQKIMLDGYEANFKKEDFEFINKLENTPNRIGQFTLFEYGDKTYLVMTTPGTERLEVLAVEELPKEIRNYFLDVAP